MTEKEIRRHKRAYAFFRFVSAPIIKSSFHFSAQKAPQMDGAYIVLANHNVELDPGLIMMSFQKHMYFVSSEHVMRSLPKWISAILKRYFAPIMRNKGHVAYDTIRSIQKILSRGIPVCMFAEGNRSFSGETVHIPPATAKLVKLARVPLITYKFEGGYFSSPRWSHTLRRGKMRGYSVKAYTVDELAAMTDDEIYKAIKADLYEDAYARQETLDQPVRFYGKRLAEALEHALYICPKCKEIGKLSSRDDVFACTCGFKVKYDETGYLLAPDTPFITVRDWDAWQHDHFKARAASWDKDAPLFCDPDVELVKIDEKAHADSLLAKGTLTLYPDRLEIAGISIFIQDMLNMSLYSHSALVFTANGVYYELHKKTGIFCARKYLSYCSIMKPDQIFYI